VGARVRAVSVGLVKSSARGSNPGRNMLFGTSDASVSATAADLLRIMLVAGIPVMLVTDRRDAAVFIVLTAITAVVSRASRAPAVAQVVFIALLTVASYLIAFGGVGGSAPDSAVAHFVLPAAAAPLLFSAALRSSVVAWPRSERHRIDVALIVMTAGLTIALGAAWELVEFACDSFLGTEMAQGYNDTIRDLIADSAGAVTGAVLAVRFWPRR
jgi:cell division protein FtsW (lipid II flippase)